MKQLRTLAFLTLSLLSLNTYAASTYEYKTEFEAFKNSPRYEAIFNENAPRIMSDLQAAIEIDKQLSVFQRSILSMFLTLKPVSITSETMPKLYAYVDNMCKNQQIKTPTIFVSRDITDKQGFFNAAAAKLLTSAGGIIIGQKMLLEFTDAELEAVVAHEIGHIKYNHMNKIIIISGISFLVSYYAIKTFLNTVNTPKIITDIFKGKQVTKGFTDALLQKTWLPVGIGMSKIIINKRFEKQADEFAYKTMGKAEGTIELFEDINKREKTYDEYYEKTYTLLQESKKDLGLFYSMGLTVNYYLASFKHEKDKLYSWFYHNTPVGPHPSNDSRIKAAKDYLASQQTVTEAHVV